MRIGIHDHLNGLSTAVSGLSTCVESCGSVTEHSSLRHGGINEIRSDGGPTLRIDYWSETRVKFLVHNRQGPIEVMLEVRGEPGDGVTTSSLEQVDA